MHVQGSSEPDKVFVRACQLCAGDGKLMPDCPYCEALNNLTQPEDGLDSVKQMKKRLVGGKTNSQMRSEGIKEALRFEC